MRPNPSPFAAIAAWTLGALLLGAVAAAGFLTARDVVQTVRAAREALPQTLKTPNAVYAYMGYRVGDLKGRRMAVPRVYLHALPEMLVAVPDARKRKAVFLTVILPHVLAENDRLAGVRAEILRLKRNLDSGAPLSDAETDELAMLGAAYGLEPDDALTLSPGPVIDIAQLLERVDGVPTALALAQAAIESGWGTSRFAREGNALFGQWTWGDGGMIPAARRQGLSHRVNAFDTLSEAVRAYMHNLNTHPAYDGLRQTRAAARAVGKPLTASMLAPTLTRYSERREVYVGELLTVIRANRLERLNRAYLSQSGVEKHSRHHP